MLVIILLSPLCHPQISGPCSAATFCSPSQGTSQTHTREGVGDTLALQEVMPEKPLPGAKAACSHPAILSPCVPSCPRAQAQPTPAADVLPGCSPSGLVAGFTQAHLQPLPSHYSVTTAIFPLHPSAPRCGFFFDKWGNKQSRVRSLPSPPLLQSQGSPGEPASLPGNSLGIMALGNFLN